MESAVEVALPAAVAEARLTGSAEGLGAGGDVVVRELRLHKEGACGLGGKRDDIRAVKVSELPTWHRLPNTELREDVCRNSSSMLDDDASNGSALQNLNPHPSNLDPDSKLVLQKSCRVIRYNGGHSKKSGAEQMDICKSKLVHDVDGVSPELTSSAAVSSISEKNQMAKQKSSTSRRGDKRNSKVKPKNRSDIFSLKNGLVAFNSSAGGSNFFGIYGLKPDVCDITKYINEQPLDELLRGSYSCSSIAKDKGKKVADTNNNLLQSIRNACSVLQDKKVSPVQNCAETDNSSAQNFSTGLGCGSSEEGQADADKGESCVSDLPMSDKVLELDHKIKRFNLAESPLYQPKDILNHLALPPSKDLDLLLLDTIKVTTSKANIETRSGKPNANRTGLPPFPWSHPFSANSKVSSDAAKASSNRTTCLGGWVKINNYPGLQKSSVDLLKDFESLTFNQSLVPSFTLKSELPERKIAPATEWGLSTSGACSTLKASSEYTSQACAAAQTLLDLAAAHAKGNPKSLKRPSAMSIKSNKSKGIERSKPLPNPPKSTLGPPFPLKLGDDAFPSKKLKQSSSHVPDRYTPIPNPSRKGPTPHQSTILPVKPPPGKLFRDSNTGSGNSMDIYPSNFVKKSISSMKPPRSAERAGHGTLQKFRKLS